MKPLNFIQWLALKEENTGLGLDNKLSNGSVKPSPELSGIANQLVSKAGPDAFGAIKTAPSKTVAQQKMMGVAQQGFNSLNPNQRTRFNIGDIATTAAASMGFKDLMKDPMS